MLELILSQGEFVSYYMWLGALLLMSFWESNSPRRQLDKPIRKRWAVNFGLIFSCTFFVRLVFPVLTVETARRTSQLDWGLFATYQLPLVLNIIFGLLILDLVRYGFHLALHRYSLLWRLHRVHHTDQEYDFTTSLRSHPFEAGVMAIINISVIILFGLHPVSVLVAETLFLTINSFNHGNVYISENLERKLRKVLVTPDMHRVHHSSLPNEFNANLGGLFSCWDRLFGTYVEQPRNGHTGMAIGLRNYADESKTTFLKMLLDPFVSSTADFSNGPGSQHKLNNESKALI